MTRNGNKSTSALLVAISNASAARHKHSLSSSSPLQKDVEEILCSRAYRKEEEDVFKPVQLCDIVHEEEEEEKEEEEEEAEIETQAKKAQLHKKSLWEWHMKRYKSSLKNQLSRAQVDDAVLRLIDHYLLRCTSNTPPTSSSSENDPLSTLGNKIDSLWSANETRIRASLPRYFEGYPVRDRIQPPLFHPQRSQKPSGLGDCLQCLAKGLPCSMSVQATGSGEGVLRGGCRRCVAEGERCIIEHDEVLEEEEDGERDVKEKVGKKREEKSGLWDWWDGVPDRDRDVDSVAEAIELWERRRKGIRLELIGSRMLWVESRGFAPRGINQDE
ncbi:uncharacterized protein TRIREDRAFT_110403 [Trichoderma reesei QM6a]|jgi:hypothetical protein|uniref:Predicted protein n=2 Tax=Hypocrea jecorina TaxID=51453 RepID=G0RRX9_HYPJQ|nr:uncharacterized protein TRIREDRAFT_110403 [Trichoderma reesei QM6a]EGR45976.1 predicted protein [Trichoderma reesei QM6a]ETR99150.1 hypothetical protein M419DRAFT_86986 [Trichoderma reesei RUT C-30]